ncbi:family 25 putative glycosyltransferase [Echria macrotheca]|uniref:Family 25 putative glycosyltransferase n=1 Tax=Echria macrotheca TaxID=438768 RepID=A0AAJ0B9Z3_9PEZI|nr:family 25 putative glycosyltransferase [Echria macrotheca]
MLLSHRVVVFVLIALAALFVLFGYGGRPAARFRDLSPLQYLQVSGRGSEALEILNGTLGFEKVFAINLPERTDRRDALTLAAAVSGIQVEWIMGVAGKDVSDRVVPGDSLDRNISRGNRGSWRAHMDALQQIVERNLTSALILEDDADWDVRIKSQLQVFAQAARAFTQPVGTSGSKPVSRMYTSAPGEQSPLEFSLSQLPKDLKPKVTAYGDDWDVLWLGHCGTEFPKRPSTAEEDPEKGQTSIPTDPSQRPPLLRVVIPNDPTVPGLDDMKAHPFALRDAMADEYPAHTRVVHASSGTTCTQAYAVSQQGARKLLWRFGLQTLTNGWDFMLKDWCDGAYVDADGRAPVCVTVQPPLFSHHFGSGGASDISAPGGGFINKEKELTPYLRLSVRLNMGRLVRGGGMGDLVDQFPDKEEA